MQDWHSVSLGRSTLPRDLSAFEIEAFFNFSDAERRVIDDRRDPALKLALALQIGFLRMTGLTPTCAIVGGFPMRNRFCSMSVKPAPPSRA